MVTATFGLLRDTPKVGGALDSGWGGGEDEEKQARLSGVIPANWPVGKDCLHSDDMVFPMLLFMLFSQLLFAPASILICYLPPLLSLPSPLPLPPLLPSPLPPPRSVLCPV